MHYGYGIIEAKLKNLGLELPRVPVPVAEYLPAKRVGEMIYCSGQGPIQDGKPAHVGRVGAKVSLEEAYRAAQLCVLNCLAAIKAVAGSLDAVKEIVQVHGFVNSAPDFRDQPKVVNGASELLVKLFGDCGRHARAALDTSNLPMNIPVEIEMLVRLQA